MFSIVVNQRIEQITDPATGPRPRFGQRHMLATTLTQDLTDLVARRGSKPTGQFLRLADRVEPLRQSKPGGGKCVVSDLMVVRHHVDRLPYHALQSFDERIPGSLMTSKRTGDQFRDRLVGRKALATGHLDDSMRRPCVVSAAVFMMPQMRLPRN